ncbi:MAG: hypothetical protein RBT84_19995, partial [FCB group bacterium]|nr:hypothetical protein [FCB group bacterium]
DVNPRVETRGYSLSSLRDSIRTRRESRFLLSLTEPDVCVTRIRGLKAGACGMPTQAALSHNGE